MPFDNRMKERYFFTEETKKYTVKDKKCKKITAKSAI